MKEKPVRRSYTREFKLEAVRQIVEQNQSIAEVALLGFGRPPSAEGNGRGNRVWSGDPKRLSWSAQDPAAGAARVLPGSTVGWDLWERHVFPSNTMKGPQYAFEHSN
jgi:hypothetical protein